MLDYVGAVNISSRSSSSVYYNKNNQTMHFYTAGDDFGIYSWFLFYLLFLSNPRSERSDVRRQDAAEPVPESRAATRIPQLFRPRVDHSESGTAPDRDVFGRVTRCVRLPFRNGTTPSTSSPSPPGCSSTSPIAPTRRSPSSPRSSTATAGPRRRGRIPRESRAPLGIPT
jgi:hypothetical protein